MCLTIGALIILVSACLKIAKLIQGHSQFHEQNGFGPGTGLILVNLNEQKNCSQEALSS